MKKLILLSLTLLSTIASAYDGRITFSGAIVEPTIIYTTLKNDISNTKVSYIVSEQTIDSKSKIITVTYN